jgi:hypothetical protein
MDPNVLALLIVKNVAQQYIYFAVSCFLRVFYLLPKFKAGRWLFLICSAVPEGVLSISHHAVTRSQKFQFSPAAISAESPL